MSITKQAAWSIFKADKLGQPEGEKALVRMTDTEMDDYMVHAEEFEFNLAKVGIEAQNEAAAIWEEHPISKGYLEAIKPYRWMADDYKELVSIFKGSKYEQLHLSALFRVNNAELLLDLAKPTA